jgi:hypothetical protein
MHCCRSTQLFVLLSTIQTRLCLHIKCPIFLPAFNQIWISRQIYAKVSSIKFQIPQKIRPVGAELIHADSRTDSRTDMTTLIGVSLRLTWRCKGSREAEIWRKYKHMPSLLTSGQDRTKPIISRTCPQVAHLNYSLILRLFKDTVLATWI